MEFLYPKQTKRTRNLIKSKLNKDKKEQIPATPSVFSYTHFLRSVVGKKCIFSVRLLTEVCREPLILYSNRVVDWEMWVRPNFWRDSSHKNCTNYYQFETFALIHAILLLLKRRCFRAFVFVWCQVAFALINSFMIEVREFNEMLHYDWFSLLFFRNINGFVILSFLFFVSR